MKAVHAHVLFGLNLTEKTLVFRYPYVFNDASPDGDMRHLLRKYDVASCGRNDAMFAISCGEATHHSRSDIIGEANIICPQGKHH